MESAQSLEAYFVEAGRRAQVVWRLDGGCGDAIDAASESEHPRRFGGAGVWIEQLGVVQGIDFATWLPDCGRLRLERFAIGYRREHGISEIAYRLSSFPGLRLRKRVWVPLEEPAVVTELLFENQTTESIELPLFVETRFRLTPGGPHRASVPPHIALATDSRAVRADNEHGQAVLLVRLEVGQPSKPGDPMDLAELKPSSDRVGEPAGGSYHLVQGPPAYGAPRGAGRCWWQGTITVPAGRSGLVRVVIAAGPASDCSEACEVTALRVAEQAERLLLERTTYYARCISEAPRLQTPQPVLNRALSLARSALEDFKHDDRAIGLGYVSGFPDQIRPIVGDALRVLYAAIELGDWSDSREILRNIIHGQPTRGQGSPFSDDLGHDQGAGRPPLLPGFVRLELPSILLHYLRWTGDQDFVEESYPAVRLATEWARRQDDNGDGRQGDRREQALADGVRTRRDEAEAHLRPALWQLRAERDLAELAAALGRRDEAQRWRRDERRTARRIEQRFWDHEQRRLVDTVRPAGQPSTTPGFVAQVESDDRLDRAIVERCRELELTEERALSGDRNVETAASAQQGPARSYDAVDRGDRARRLLVDGWSADGAQALQEVAELPFRWPQAGFFPELAFRDSGAVDLRGCFHHGVTPSYGLVHPLLAGLWGLRADAPNGALRVAPKPPATWTDLKIERLRLGDRVVDLTCRRTDQGQELRCRLRGPALRLTVELALPAAPGRPIVVLDGGLTERSGWQRQPGPRGESWSDTFDLQADGEGGVALGWEAEPFVARLSERLPTLQPGGAASIRVDLTNVGPARRAVTLRAVCAERDSEVEVILEPDELAIVSLEVAAGPRARGHLPVEAELRDEDDSLLWCRRAYLPIVGRSKR